MSALDGVRRAELALRDAEKAAAAELLADGIEPVTGRVMDESEITGMRIRAVLGIAPLARQVEDQPIARCRRGCPDGECYCSEPSYGDAAYTGICQGCGGYEECYCGED